MLVTFEYFDLTIACKKIYGIYVNIIFVILNLKKEKIWIHFIYFDFTLNNDNHLV